MHAVHLGTLMVDHVRWDCACYGVLCGRFINTVSKTNTDLLIRNWRTGEQAARRGGDIANGVSIMHKPK